MSRYIVRIVGPAGREMYLARGKRVERDAATRYPHPSNAMQAMVKYIQNYPASLITANVIDLRDPERRL